MSLQSHSDNCLKLSMEVGYLQSNHITGFDKWYSGGARCKTLQRLSANQNHLFGFNPSLGRCLGKKFHVGQSSKKGKVLANRFFLRKIRLSLISHDTAKELWNSAYSLVGAKWAAAGLLKMGIQSWKYITPPKMGEIFLIDTTFPFYGSFGRIRIGKPSKMEKHLLCYQNLDGFSQ